MQTARRLPLHPLPARVHFRSAESQKRVQQRHQQQQHHHHQHHHQHHHRTLEMSVQISIMLMIASASSQQVDSQEATGSLEQTARLVSSSLEKDLRLAHEPAPGNELAAADRLLVAGDQPGTPIVYAHRAHLARFLKTAIGNKQRELAEEATREPSAGLMSARVSPSDLTVAPAPPKPEAATVRRLLSELSLLDLGRAGHAQGRPPSAAPAMAPSNSPNGVQRRQQHNRHVPCFFNAITCF